MPASMSTKPPREIPPPPGSSDPAPPAGARHLVDEIAPADGVAVDVVLAESVERLRASATSDGPDAAIILQDYTPMASCLEAELAAAYWSTVGGGAFSSNAVPFIINNDGRLSHDAAAVLLANCRETAADTGPIEILEIGAGSGLFALYLLDAFAELCRAEGTDHYDRLRYYVTDGSRRTIEDWQATGQFDGHGERVILGLCDARAPTQLETPGGRRIALHGLRAVFANYVLDALPAAVIRQRDGRVEQLCLRTCLGDRPDLAANHPELDIEEIQRLAASPDPAERLRLLPAIDALRFDTSFVPLIDAALPHVDEAIAFGGDLPRLMLNFGAIDCLRACLDRLADGGLVLISDYGPTQKADIAKAATAIRFGPSVATSVNFPLIEHCLAERAVMVGPREEAKRAIQSRLIIKTDLPATRQAYESATARPGWYWDDEVSLLPRARTAAQQGRTASALALFGEALAEDPGNWLILGETAQLLTRSGEPGEAVRLAGAAVRRNPWYSAWLWTVLGDALFSCDRIADAHAAYAEAVAINPSDVAANLSLSFTHARHGRLRAALDAVSAALAFDRTGEYRERILHQQQHVIRQLETRWAGEQARRQQRAASFE